MIDGEVIEPSNEAEHVGVVRSVNGNLPNIMNRIASFKKALGAIASCSLARGHRANPKASLRILSTYCTPVMVHPNKESSASVQSSPSSPSTLSTTGERSIQEIGEGTSLGLLGDKIKIRIVLPSIIILLPSPIPFTSQSA